MRADKQEPSAPLFPDEILRQSIRQHGTGWSNVDHIASAVLLAQPIVGRAYVEKKDIATGASDPQQRVGGKVGNYQGNATLGQCDGCGERIVVLPDFRILKSDLLVQELACRVVVTDRELRARQSVIACWDLNQGEARLGVRLP